MRALLTLLTVALAAGCATAAPNPAAPEPAANGTPATPASGAEAAPASAPLALATGPLAPQTKGPVSIQALTRFKTVHVGPDGAELDVLVRLKGDGAVPAERAPMDLVIVLDRSGSMRGDKLVAVKSAALKLLDRLGKDDRVTLISYSDDVTVDALGGPTGPSGRALRDALMRVSAGGSTALGPALFKAIEQLERGDRGEARMAHVMLLSDGLANQGEQRPEVIGARAAGGFRVGVSVSTLGVGLDYNEDLMTRVADQGGGRYHFIKDSEAVAAVLNDEMNGLVATVARGVELELKGVQVIKAFGYPSDVVDGVTKVRVGALGAGQVREVVLRVKVPAGVAPSVALGELAVNFRDATAAGAPGRAAVALAVGTTHDAELAKSSEDTEVAVRVHEVEAAEKLEQVAIATSQGDFDGASQHLNLAVEGLRRELQKAPQNQKLRAQLDEFEEAAAEMDDAKASASARKSYTKKFKAKAYSAKKR